MISGVMALREPFGNKLIVARAERLISRLRPGHLDSFWPICHPVTCIQTRAGALTNLHPCKVVSRKGMWPEMANVAVRQALFVARESIMTILSNLSRRQLLSTAATTTVAGIAPNVPFNAHAKSEIAQQAQVLAPPSNEAQVQNFSAVTLVRLREISERNCVRREAGLPLLSVPRELRRMKQAADAETCRDFAEAHRSRIYQRMLARVRRQYGDPHWAPNGVLSGGGLWFGARVDEQLTKLYSRLAVRPVLRDSIHAEGSRGAANLLTGGVVNFLEGRLFYRGRAVPSYMNVIGFGLPM
jgi:hypothetical protein